MLSVLLYIYFRYASQPPWGRATQPHVDTL